MATGFSRSIQASSEPFYDYSCNPCSKEGKNMEAENYCKECCQFLCPTCRKHHDKFLVNHQMLDKADMISQGLQQQPSFPTERCGRHPSEMINLFCPTHDTACCSACVALEHRPCTDVTYLTKAAKGIQKSKEYNNTKDAMTHVRDNLKHIWRARQDDKIRIGKEKTKVQTTIKEFRKKLNTLLDNMEKVTLNDLDDNHKNSVDIINADIKLLEDIISTLDNNLQQLETFQGNNESELFVYVKKGKQSSVEGNHILDQAAIGVGNELIQFIVNTKLERFLAGFKSLGDFSKGAAPKKGPIVYTAKLHSDVNVKVMTDYGNFTVTATCQLPDKSILIIDKTNNKLKRLDTSYAVSDSLYMPGGPWGVCVTGPQEVAVSNYGSETIQFVSTRAKLSTTVSVDVGVKCRGIAFHNDELFVACSGSKKEGPGHIRVYDTVGKLNRTFQNDPSGKSLVSWPMHIAISTDGTRVHVADQNKGIITLNKQGKVIATFSDPRLTKPFGVCLDNIDNLIACGWTSDNVFNLGHGGSNPRVLLKETDGIKNPYSVCYDRFNHRLVITMESSNIIKVFDLI